MTAWIMRFWGESGAGVEDTEIQGYFPAWQTLSLREGRDVCRHGTVGYNGLRREDVAIGGGAFLYVLSLV